MNLLKEGVIYKNERIWRQNGNYHLCFALGTWEPTVSTSQEIFASESNTVRFSLSQSEITTGWSDLRGIDEVKIDKILTPTEDIRFNRVFILYEGRDRSKYTIIHKPFNTVEIIEPLSHPFVLGDRVHCNGNFYTIEDIEGLLLYLEPFPLAPPLPNSGDSVLKDATGTLLIGSITDSQYIIKKDTEVNIILDGSTF